MTLNMSPAFMSDALCATTDPDAFVPDKGGSVDRAKQICVACPVTALCLEYAQVNNLTVGVYGGLSAVQRSRLRRDAA